MSKMLAAVFAGLFAFSVTLPALAQDKKQEHKGTAAQGTVQKKDQAKKKDGTGAAKKSTKSTKKTTAPKKGTADAAPKKGAAAADKK